MLGEGTNWKKRDKLRTSWNQRERHDLGILARRKREAGILTRKQKTLDNLAQRMKAGLSDIVHFVGIYALDNMKQYNAKQRSMPSRHKLTPPLITLGKADFSSNASSRTRSPDLSS